jgi:hypothetical protein
MNKNCCYTLLGVLVLLVPNSRFMSLIYTRFSLRPRGKNTRVRAKATEEIKSIRIKN